MKIYKPQLVQDLEQFYGDLLFEVKDYPSIKDHLEALASKMWVGVQEKNSAIFREISNYHWDHLGRNITALSKMALGLEDCKAAIANEYGFRRWTEVEHLDIQYDIDFELTINLLLDGNLKELKKKITKNPALVNGKSDYGHKATLLHYAASNGVELWRQKVPLNLPEIVGYLIASGANKKAKMKVYNGEYTASELLPSSAHPRNAGVLEALRKYL